MPTLEQSSIPSLPDIDIHVGGITKLLLKLNPQKANGPDQVPTRVLREAAEEISPYLSIIFQQSLQSSQLPTDWLTANISPIYKKGSRSVAANYRPVSLTSVSCKLLEHIIFHHIMAHLQQHSILSKNQHGFRTGHSCETQLVTTIEDLALSLEYGQQVDMLILDFSKAFWHGGSSKTAPQTRTLWYQRRHQRVDLYLANHSYPESRSWWGSIYWGPGPIRRPTGNCTRTLDVPPLHQWHRSQNIDRDTSPALRWWQSPVQRDMVHTRWHYSPRRPANTSREWSHTWQMKFHPLKCYHLRVTKKKTPLDIQYEMLGHNLERVEHYPYLDVEISRDLSWTNHVKKVTSKANRALGFVRRNLSSCRRPVKVQMYQALVRPHLEYAATAWDPCHLKNINSLEMVQRRSARFVTGNYNHIPGTVTRILSDLQWPWPYKGADRTQDCTCSTDQSKATLLYPSHPISPSKPEQRDILTRKDSSKWELRLRPTRTAFSQGQ